MSYEDGAKSIFLYTKGTKGNPPEELLRLLHYMEDPSDENAQTEGLRSLHKMVTEVKRDREVGLAYMKSFEREQRIRKQGWAEGRTEGRAETLHKMLEAKLDVEIILKAGFTREEIDAVGMSTASSRN